jgi:hypothetical protein
MKKAIFFAAMLVAGSANAGLWASVATSDWENVKPEANYTLEVYGFDARVYEFTPKTAPHMTCVVTATGGTSNMIQQNCFPKNK